MERGAVGRNAKGFGRCWKIGSEVIMIATIRMTRKEGRTVYIVNGLEFDFMTSAILYCLFDLQADWVVV